MKILFLSLVSLIGMTALSAQDLPPNADPGKCYAKCITQDEFNTVTEVLQTAPAYKKLKTVPATFKTVEERVLVKEASKKLVYVPAVYETIEVPYVSKEASKNLEIIPATFGSDSKTFETYPKVGRWEYVKVDNCKSANKTDCMVLCYVEYPEQKTTVSIATLANNASTRDIPVSEVKATYKKQVVKTPARMEEVEIPAEYAIIKRQVVDQPARVIEETVPAVTTTVTRTVLTKKGGVTVWEEIDCSIVGKANLLPILYEYGSARITESSKKIIDDNLLTLMRDKPNLKIEILSHTDSRGNDEFNMALSQQRAQSVINYLVSRGISRNRLVARGYGESQLVNRCSNGVECSEAEHQANRRTEFRIIQ